MILTYMCKTCGCSFRSRNFGNIERFIEPCILLLLSRGPSHGYGLMEDLEKHCGEKIDIGNLYRSLRRMEKIGWVNSNWEKGNIGPNKRKYEITIKGKSMLKEAFISLKRTHSLINHFFNGYKKVFGKE
ncbi:TPA: PadR family transcriptional regulator [Patescibacteria group bacterium]|nr:PadR family transcriptional regulator [Patescibacteria group bacterium]